MKFAIITYYTDVSPWKEKWEEQHKTWIPLARHLGIPVYSLVADPFHPEDVPYSQTGEWITFRGKKRFEITETFKYDVTLSHATNAMLQWAKDQELDYFLSVDNDVFVEPSRLLELVKEYSTNPNINYAGHCMPYRGWFPMDYPQLFTNPEEINYASGGAGIMLSKKAINVAAEYFLKELELEEEKKWANDYILGTTLRKHNIFLYQDGRFWVEFPGRPILYNPSNAPFPYIGDKDSLLVTQHQADGHMHKIMEKLGHISVI